MSSLTLALAFLAVAGSGAPDPASAQVESDPTATYWVYVGSESADFVHRIRFGPEGAVVEEEYSVAHLYRQSSVPELYSESEAPHGIAVDAGGGTVYLTTGHGLPSGKLWAIEAGSGRLLADPVDLGRFPASLDVSPDGGYVAVANFNLHGRMEPSNISVVRVDGMTEVGRIETCTMPHGSRVHPAGRRHYSVCMMDDQLVELDLLTLEVRRRYHLAAGAEGPLDPSDRGPHDPHGPHAGHDMGHAASCSPTWVQPTPDGAFAWVVCNRSDELVEIDLESWTHRRRIATGRGPYNVDVTADGRILVVTLKQGDGVEFFELESGERLARLPTSTRVVHGIALSPDSRYAFISVEGIGSEPGKVDIFDLRALEVVASVPVGQQASGIAFWRMAAADES
ncbi:MAG: YncE family protein [Gemmatimonadales bacterium]|nr:MAG: YncE family protein [Gemmatimonadales bacterium]